MLENIITLGYENEKYTLIYSHFVYVTYLCYVMNSFNRSRILRRNHLKCFFLLRKNIKFTVATIKGKRIQRVYFENTGKLFNVVNSFYRQKSFGKSSLVALCKWY